MRYSITQLCGGKALMVTPRETLTVDMKKAFTVLSGMGEIKSHDDLMVLMKWKGMEVTLYPQGKVMFHPLDDKNAVIVYANEILGALIG